MESRKKLNKAERVKLYQLQRLRYSARRIGRELNRSHSTVLRELKRNASEIDKHGDYITRASQAQEATQQRRRTASSRKMRLKSESIRHYVELHLSAARWSPETIAGKLTLLGFSISYEAIYQFINEERPDLKPCLLIAGKSRRRRRSGKRPRRMKQPAAPKRSIELLPKAAKERTEIGHFELDAIVGKKGKSVLQNKIDRHSRKIFLDKVPSLHAEVYANALMTRLTQDVPQGVLKTILQDNGSEHAAHASIDATLNIQSYFCHPYCASERGSVENANRSPRRFLPKGTDFDDIPHDFIQWIEDQANNRPMKVLGFKTPNEVWAEGLAKLAA